MANSETAQVAPAPAKDGVSSEEQPSPLRSIVQTCIWMFVVWSLFQNVVSMVSKSQTTPSSEPGEQRPTFSTSLWPADTKVDVYMYISSGPYLPINQGLNTIEPVWTERSFRMGDFSDERTFSGKFYVDENMQNNGTIWAHYLVTKESSSPEASQGKGDSYFVTYPLSLKLPRKVYNEKRNLLQSIEKNKDKEADKEEGPVDKSSWTHYSPNITLSFVPGVSQIPNEGSNNIALHYAPRFHNSSTDLRHFPVTFQNTFWQLLDDMEEVNATVSELPLHMTLNNEAAWKFQILAPIDHTIRNSVQSPGGVSGPLGRSNGREYEEIKKIFIQGNPVLLSITFVASLLHTLFEMLAFKSEVSHWRKRKDNIGVSVRTLFANIITKTIVLLYLMDNNENTSYVILFSEISGIGIEVWKITKAVNVKVKSSEPGSWLPFAITLEDKKKLSKAEKQTEEYDAIAFWYLYRIALPLILAYAGYSLMYETHKSWYSFVIATLVGSVYAYGFLMMVPSLYINYRLQSVAHMPGRAMIYKFFNTFIDDLFAFAVKMPLLHRLATFRDDIIFFVYLYQAWIYRVDYSRVNEFGQGGEEEEEEAEEGGKEKDGPPELTGVEDKSGGARRRKK